MAFGCLRQPAGTRGQERQLTEIGLAQPKIFVGGNSRVDQTVISPLSAANHRSCHSRQGHWRKCRAEYSDPSRSPAICP
jgi:hypothetical protein